MLTTHRTATIVAGLALTLVATRALQAQTAPAAPVAQAATAQSEPPPGPGLAIIKEKCSTCHSTASVFGQHRSPDDWAATVQLMVDRGADLSPDEQNVVIGYLAENFPAPAKPAAK